LLGSPLFHIDGRPNGFARVKPSKPRKSKDGKVRKYESPLGISTRVLFTPSAAAAASDVSVDLFLTEGEKKCWTIHQMGFACLGLCGIWNWQKRDSDPRELNDDLAGVEWLGRRVGIVFDTDEKRNPKVNQARAELARVLTDLGANVCLIDLPVERATA
jgi:putative DNA primase/helicase